MNDVSQLAAAMASGSIHPNYIQKSWTPGYTLVPEALPSQLCLDDSTSAQIARLLGGSVIQRPAQSLQGQVPDCNWIQLPDGNVVRAADVAQVADQHPSIWGKSELCGYEQMLSMGIPGGVQGADCGGDPMSGYTPGSASASYTPPAPVVIPTPILPSTPVVIGSRQNIPGAKVQAPSTVVTGTPGASVGAPADSTANTSVSGFDLSSIPWWGWAIGVGAIYMMLPKGR